VIVFFHGQVPVVQHTVYDNVENCRGDDISLCDASFCWEGISKEPALLWDYGMCVPEIVKYPYCIAAHTIVSEY